MSKSDIDYNASKPQDHSGKELGYPAPDWLGKFEGQPGGFAQVMAQTGKKGPCAFGWTRMSLVDPDAPNLGRS